MSYVKLTNKSNTVGFSFVSHGSGRYTVGPGESVTITLDPDRGPWNKGYLENFYSKYSADLTFETDLTDSTASGDFLSETAADKKYAQKTDVYTKTEVYKKTETMSKEEITSAIAEATKKG